LLLENGTCGTDCIDAAILQIQLSAQKTVRNRVLSFPLTGTLTEEVKLRNP